jgi:3-oxoacyl-[acyl-carrier-protein] synthase III
VTSVEIAGSGSYLPAEPITNEQLAALFGRKMIWLSEMLGARTRHFAMDFERRELRSGETNARMATEAARRAIQDADVDPMSIDLIVMSTSTPDYPFPATVLFVQEQLGLPSCCVMELRAGCGGMAQAFVIATSMIASGKSKTALLIGSDLISPFISVFNKNNYGIDKDFLASVAMFGDGAGALVLTPSTGPGGVIDCMSQSISTGRKPAMLLRSGGALAPPGAANKPTEHLFQHDFKAILKHGPELIEAAAGWLRDQKGYGFSDVDFFIPPQVNARLIDLTAAQMGVGQDKVVSDFGRVGNTGSASIYIALDQMNRKGRLKAGDLLVLLPAEATKWLYGAIVVRWAKARTAVA